MGTYIALLRGINVGGKKLPMAELREMCASLKLKNVQTYIQSGNVVLDYDGTALQLEEFLQKGIAKWFKIDVKVVVRTASDLKHVIKSNPFGEAAYLTFLKALPEIADYEPITKAKTDKEEFKVIGREVYFFLPEGYGRTKLNNNFLESKLKVSATTRNLRTVKTLLEMAETAEIKHN